MISKLRDFTKTKLATILVAIIIIPFVFWGMGGIFRGGNTNSLAKINNKNISTQELINHISTNRLTAEIIKDNIDNNIIEDLLQSLIARNLLNMEIKDLNISISDQAIFNMITKDENFLDENKNFSRIKYEKFLIKNNISAAEFELRLKNNELGKKLFNYISGGLRSPYFLINNEYIDENKIIEIEYINLESLYKKKFEKKEIKNFIKENEELFEIDVINFSYSVIKPENLVDSNEFNEEFFKKIDEIENLVFNENKIEEIKNIYKLKLNNIQNYSTEREDTINENHQIIYEKRNDRKIQLIDKNDYFLLYEIKSLEKVLPKINEPKFINKVEKKLSNREKIEYNKKIISKIENKKFNDTDFYKLSNNKNLYEIKTLNSKKDKNFFTNESINLLYSMPKNSYFLMLGKDQYIYLTKIKKINYKNLPVDPKIKNIFTKKTNNKNKEILYTSYDNILSQKYNITINQKTLDRFKNNFQ